MLIFLSMLESDAERQIFLELYNQYGNAMLRVAQRYFPKSQQDAEDAVQNVWLKAVQNFSKILEVACKKRGAYLVIIVRNEAITILRKRKEELPLEDAFADETAAVGDGDGKSIIEIIQTMPDTFRAVLEMRFVEERSTKEIAAALHLKETTVNTRIHRGRAILIKKLREEYKR
ncbi:putative RNA polymerase ECF subfamily sigma factor [Oscillibacter valericigenes Sjm18-20]|nr:putative RNA polymerase ECF subfamily sigma factor [Oscillibacter valericigenes Sjm18-20]